MKTEPGGVSGLIFARFTHEHWMCIVCIVVSQHMQSYTATTIAILVFAAYLPYQYVTLGCAGTCMCAFTKTLQTPMETRLLPTPSDPLPTPFRDPTPSQLFNSIICFKARNARGLHDKQVATGTPLPTLEDVHSNPNGRRNLMFLVIPCIQDVPPWESFIILKRE